MWLTALLVSDEELDEDDLALLKDNLGENANQLIGEKVCPCLVDPVSDAGPIAQIQATASSG